MKVSEDAVKRIEWTAWHESVEPFAYADGDALVVRLRLASRSAKRVEVVHFDKFLPDKTRKTERATHYAFDGPKHELYQAHLRQYSKRFKYWFRIETNAGILYLSRAGVRAAEPDLADAFEVPYLGERDRYSPPAWANGICLYQIFPDRFYRLDTPCTDGDRIAPPREKEWADWDSEPTPHSFFGGNLCGIRKRLDHLVDLGIEALYLTPIFTAPSNHKYDTIDYFSVDPDFGDLQSLRELVETCHRSGIRVVLDAVLNHMGARHPFFLDLLTRGEESPYKDWIYPHSWPLSKENSNYETFGYVADMPKWRTACPEAEDYLCRVGEYWITEADIDGWRLDVSDEVEHRFWQHFRDRVKAANPDAVLCGEIWQPAAPWLRGDQFDTVMNYPLGGAILDWIARKTIDGNGFFERVEQIRAVYPEPVLHALWNMLDSHDTPRLLTACADDVKRVMTASFLQFTLAGSPLVYYGDEIGMKGGHDPLCRGGMIWEEDLQNRRLLDHYRELIRLRKDHPALRNGNLRPIMHRRNSALYAFTRSSEEQTVLCLANGGLKPLSVRLTDRGLPRGQYRVVYGPYRMETISYGDTITLPELSGLILLRTGDE